MAPRSYTDTKYIASDERPARGRQVITVDAATLALDPDFTKSGVPTVNAVSRPSGESRPRPNENDQAQTGLATAAIAAGFAVGALVIIAGACYLVYFIRRNRKRKHPKWNMVGPTITTSDISAPMPLESAGPYSHLSAYIPRAPPSRKPVPKFVIEEKGADDDVSSTDSHANSVRIVKTVVQEVHRSVRPAPPRPQRPPSLTVTPTAQYFDRPPLAATNLDRASIIPSPATPATKRQTLRSAPAAASEYAKTILDEPSPFIQTAPMIPVANPFVDPTPPVPPYSGLPGQPAPAPSGFTADNSLNRFSLAGTLTAVSTARSVFFPTDLPFENRTPPSLPASALGSTETPPSQHRGLPTLDQFPMPPASRAESARSVTSGGSARSRASRPPVPLRISTFPYAMPRVEAVTAPSTASTVVEPGAYVASPAADPTSTHAAPPTLPKLIIEPTTGAGQRTSDLLEAMGLERHVPAFRSAGLELIASLRFNSPEGLQRVDPALSTDDAEGLAVAVDDALRSASREQRPPFRPMSA